MTHLEKLKTWLSTSPGFAIFSDFWVDYTDRVDPGTGSISPGGLVEIERRRDIVGNVTVTNQYNFSVYCVLEKAPGDDVGATINADWVMDLQEWVQKQSALGLAPVFGDAPWEEKIVAQNGVLYDINEGTATYMVQLSVRFKRKYEVENPWLI